MKGASRTSPPVAIAIGGELQQSLSSLRRVAAESTANYQGDGPVRAGLDLCSSLSVRWDCRSCPWPYSRCSIAMEPLLTNKFDYHSTHLVAHAGAAMCRLPLL